MASSREYANLVELLQSHALENPDTVAFRYLADGENETVTLQFGKLDRIARTIGAQLQRITRPGDRAVMLYNSGLDPVTTFLGCLYAGVVPVPSFPLLPNRPPTAFLAMLKDAQTDLILTTTATQAFAEPMLANMPHTPPLRWMTTDTLDAASAQEW